MEASKDTARATARATDAAEKRYLRSGFTAGVRRGDGRAWGAWGCEEEGGNDTALCSLTGAGAIQCVLVINTTSGGV